MLTHARTMQGVRPERAQGDTNRARAPFSPILEACCDHADLYRMQLYSIDRHSRRRDGRATHVVKDGLHDAADRILACMQRELRARRAAINSVEDALERGRQSIEFWYSQRWAIDALEHLSGSPGYAKRRQLEHSNNQPLAVCMGGGKQRLITTLLGDVTVQALGCFCVFDDSTRPSGRTMWSRLCPGCRHSKGQSLRRAVYVRKEQHRLIFEASRAS
jgi:hypothetical protein